MNSDEKKRRDCMRTIHLLSKLEATKKGDWTLPALLAYCQGRAYELAEDEATMALGGRQHTRTEGSVGGHSRLDCGP